MALGEHGFVELKRRLLVSATARVKCTAAHSKARRHVVIEFESYAIAKTCHEFLPKPVDQFSEQ
jgi:hypothetical protein